jgi:hypothetical protein
VSLLTSVTAMRSFLTTSNYSAVSGPIVDERPAGCQGGANLTSRHGGRELEAAITHAEVPEDFGTLDRLRAHLARRSSGTIPAIGAPDGQCAPAHLGSAFLTARVSHLRDLSPIPPWIWDQFVDYLYLQLRDASLRHAHCSQWHVYQPALQPTKVVHPFSGMAFCEAFAPISQLVLPTWSVDCSTGVVCAHSVRVPVASTLDGNNATRSGKRVKKRAALPRCLTERLHTFQRLPSLVDCAETTYVAAHSSSEPFARGAHKTVAEASFRGRPLVLKRTPFEVKNATEAKFSDEIVAEWEILRELAPNPFSGSAFLMGIYGGCIGSEYGNAQAVLAEGPLLPLQFVAGQPRLRWSARMAIASGVVKTLLAMSKQGVVLCGLNKEQLGIDSSFHAKVLDVGGSVLAHSDGTPAGWGAPCSKDEDCVRVPRRADCRAGSASWLPTCPADQHRRCYPGFVGLSRCVVGNATLTGQVRQRVGYSLEWVKDTYDPEEVAPNTWVHGRKKWFNQTAVDASIDNALAAAKIDLAGSPGVCTGFDATALVPVAIKRILADLLLADLDAGRYEAPSTSFRDSLATIFADDGANLASLRDLRSALADLASYHDDRLDSAANEDEIAEDFAALMDQMRGNAAHCVETQGREKNRKC